MNVGPGAPGFQTHLEERANRRFDLGVAVDTRDVVEARESFGHSGIGGDRRLILEADAVHRIAGGDVHPAVRGNRRTVD